MSPEAILTGHVESVVCVSISTSLALVVSGARRKPRNLSVYVYMFVCLFVCLFVGRWELSGTQHEWRTATQVGICL